MQKRKLLVSWLPQDRNLAFCETHCVASVGNVEQPGKFRQLSVSSSAYTAVKHRVVENTLMEVALGRVDGVVELWRRKEGEWKSVLHLPLSSSAVFCLEFLSPRCEPSDRAAKNSDSQLLVVTTDGVSLLVVPESSSAEDGSHTLRLTFDLFYESTVRCATVLLLGADQGWTDQIVIGYRMHVSASQSIENNEVKLAHLRIEFDEEPNAANQPKRIVLVERAVLSVDKAEHGTIRQFAFVPKGLSIPDLLVATTNSNVNILRYQSGTAESGNGNLNYSFSVSQPWLIESPQSDDLQISVSQLNTFENDSAVRRRNCALLSNAQCAVLLDLENSTVRQIAELHAAKRSDEALVAQFDHGPDCGALFVRASAPNGVQLCRVSLLRHLLTDADARQLHFSNLVSTARCSDSLWHSLRELLRVGPSGERELLRKALDESLAKSGDSVAKLGSAAHFRSARFLLVKMCLDALTERASDNSARFNEALQVSLYVQLLQMHALLVRAVSVTCQFETNSSDSQQSSGGRFEKSQASGSFFNVAQLLHEAASQHTAMAKLFEIVDKAISMLQSASNSRRTENTDDDQSNHTDVRFAVHFVRYLLLFLVEHTLTSSAARRQELRLLTLPLAGDRGTLQLLRESLLCIHLLLFAGAKRVPMTPNEQQSFDCLCDAVSALSACSPPDAAQETFALPSNVRGELLAVRSELRDSLFTAWLNANLLSFATLLRQAALCDANERDLLLWITVKPADESPCAKRVCLSNDDSQWDVVWCKPLREERLLLTCSCCAAVTCRMSLLQQDNKDKLRSIWALRCTKSCPICDGRWIVD